MNKLRIPQNNAVSSQETRAASLRLNSEASAGPLLLAFCEQQARRAAARPAPVLGRCAPGLCAGRGPALYQAPPATLGTRPCGGGLPLPAPITAATRPPGFH